MAVATGECDGEWGPVAVYQMVLGASTSAIDG
jgi:hypothetical protein